MFDLHFYFYQPRWKLQFTVFTHQELRTDVRYFNLLHSMFTLHKHYKFWITVCIPLSINISSWYRSDREIFSCWLVNTVCWSYSFYEFHVNKCQLWNLPFTPVWIKPMIFLFNFGSFVSYFVSSHDTVSLAVVIYF